MRITVYNIDGSELARWATWQKSALYDVYDIGRPSFNLLPNKDERCPYQIEFEDGSKKDLLALATGIPLDLAIDIAIVSYEKEHPEAWFTYAS
jgi:hypothetical protein